LAHSDEYYATVITAVFQRYLGRIPLPAGLASWTNSMLSGLTDEQVEAALVGSAEYINKHGGVGPGWVTGLCQDVLGRTPSQTEINGCLQAIKNGATPYAIASGLTTSQQHETSRILQEYKNIVGGTPSASDLGTWVNGLKAHTMTDEDVVASMIGSNNFYQGSGSSPAAWWNQAVTKLFGSGY